MPIDYLFLMPLMPPAMVDPQRRELRKLCFQQLQKLECTYRVWLLGDLSSNHELPEQFKIINSIYETKEDKLFEVGKILEKETTASFRYLVRLDDDDIINPSVFDQCAQRQYCCYVDSIHWFYDLSSGKVSTQSRPWFPNTMIHTFADAMTKIDAIGGSTHAGSQNFLFACDHSQAWHTYYRNQKLTRLSAKCPLYIRILNPGSITASANLDGHKAEYLDYLTTFGDWNGALPKSVEQVKSSLDAIWKKTEGDLVEYKFPRANLWQKLKHRIRN